MKNIKDSNSLHKNPQTIGGQAVIEGVMMRGKQFYAMAIRKSDNTIEIVENQLKSAENTSFFKKLPIVRGVFAFVSSMFLGYEIITKSAEIALGEEISEPTKFDKFIAEKFGEKLSDVVMILSVMFSIAFSVGLFMLLPTWIASFTKSFIGEKTWALSIFEGLLRIFILVLYVFSISQMKDIKRIFGYHGAEHKTINCLESGEDLTVDNVFKHSRLHKRCGTSFLLFVMIISMIVFFFVRTDVVYMRFLLRILFVPLIAGLSYEVIKFAGTSKNPIVFLISYPGMMLQKITTKEPDAGQIECAIAAVKALLAKEVHV